MEYWYGKLKDTKSSLPAPLPPRTNLYAPKDSPRTTEERAERKLEAQGGDFTSLRQFGKFHQITAYGSIFNAESMVKLARLEGVKDQAGKYDARVITTSTPADYVNKVKALIKVGCPVIVPFDCDDDGDPYQRSGKEAHWCVVFGWYTDGDVYFVHYHWGSYRYARALDFAASTQGLTANAFLTLQKVEVYDEYGTLESREHMAVRGFKKMVEDGSTIKMLAEPKPNVEFTNPRTLDAPFILKESNDLLKGHGFDPWNLKNAGLKSKLVAVYPVSLESSIHSALS